MCSYHFSMIVTIVMFLFAGVQILQCSVVMLVMVLFLVDRFGEVVGASPLISVVSVLCECTIRVFVWCLSVLFGCLLCCCWSM